ncbi:uncharacterized protein LY79DRAFT_675384 [Colletotrichum navitas]|uniref:Uncharacterized protein n=1 Tax=Colletotrichum navitas TaxID=681940 RepID=A0AAD8PIK0_9PEZI|nr:uncharacterized protein LY79DRAFT_675384 [Colletotrichum navitas]KAK1561705.1 hypothetical protein LY79DRAFT_675384 [Colletotrichum navitas]
MASWFADNRLADTADAPLEFSQEPCAKQSDAYNCGIFAIEVVVALLAQSPIPQGIYAAMSRTRLPTESSVLEKKVSEILASRESKTTEPAPAPDYPDINDGVRRQLEALERRIESEERERDDTWSEGLRFLLAAKQAKEAGNDVVALQMYEQALPFPPGQAKLLGKIEKLRSKLGNKLPAETAWAPASTHEGLKRHGRATGDMEGLLATWHRTMTAIEIFWVTPMPEEDC